MKEDPLTSPSYGPRPQAKKAQETAHSKADQHGVNPRWNPKKYGRTLARAWDEVMPSQLSPSQADSLREKLKEYMDKAWKYAKDKDISLTEAMEKVEHPFEPSSGPPPPIPGEAPSQVGAGWHGSVAGSPESSKAMEIAWEKAKKADVTPRSDPDRWSEILDKAYQEVGS